MKKAFTTKPADAWAHSDPELYRLAETFIDMQQNRHSADYDNSRKCTRTDTLDKVEWVAEAFRMRKEIRNETVAQKFLVSLLSKYPPAKHPAKPGALICEPLKRLAWIFHGGSNQVPFSDA